MSNVTAQVPTGGWKAVTTTGESAIETIVANSSRTLLASDFDGTLAGIVDDPTQARINPASHRAFCSLGALVGQVAIVTGREVEMARSLGDLDDAPGLERLVLLGQYGQEQWDAASGELVSPPAPPEVRQAIIELQNLLAEPSEQNLRGVRLEDKGRAVGVHTRRAEDPSGAFAWLVEPVTRIAQHHGLVVEPGRNVIELRGSTITKGDGIDTLVARFDPQVVVMMGDDLGDLAAFERIKELGAQGRTGICVVSGSDEQPVVAAAADVLCDGPMGVAAWMEDLAQALRQARP
ncbi:trehalose-phosphatase [Luteococcus sp. Sow4_B9]|uniref:trehalose-phosphatase n=1 Tax=Luteococcus sp. Sow4_B9 TaxID=3438792 RepID=UPI003F994D31